MWKDEATATDILLAAQDIQRFTTGMSYADFLRDDKTQAAAVQRIIVMGEAAKRLSEEFRTAHPQIQWRQVSGMRDRCIHRYNEIKLDIVWEVVTRDAPVIAEYLKGVVRPPSD
jgi:uncharacterized protein with HEPN domain